MKTLQTPQDQDWNRFWGREKSRQFSKLSWSKQRIIHVLRPLCRPGATALDAGCGSGFFSKFFYDQGMSVTALDYSQSALDMAAQVTKGEAKLIRADMVNDNLSTRMTERFDLIFSDGLLEHFIPVEQDKILTNLISILNPGGIIVTFVPNRWSPWELIRPLYMPGIDEKPFVLQELLSVHQRNDLNVIDRGGVNVLPFRLSPEFLGSVFGMLLFTIARK